MASEVEIVNVALTLLGESRITSIDDDVKPARDAKAVIAVSRDALLAGYDWSFAMTRTQLPKLVDVPLFGFGSKFQMPSDCLRLVMIGSYYVGIDLTDYRGAPTEEYMIEGREILTDLGDPLNVRYVKRVTDTSQFQANFTKALSCQLAVDLAESLTQSETKRARAEVELKKELALAVKANAIELPPRKLADDEWLISRL